MTGMFPPPGLAPDLRKQLTRSGKPGLTIVPFRPRKVTESDTCTPPKKKSEGQGRFVVSGWVVLTVAPAEAGRVRAWPLARP
ncbi:hypothetical protein, partial [Actinoplanes sp. NPDC051851]|uniref:hypothetical protein n=1 Tax=Actinoplanes sp. NPDC051851 TaxID=3154753 RepID=UPI00342018DD